MVLALSEYKPTAWFGGMLALTMVVAFLAEVFILPATIKVMPRLFGADRVHALRRAGARSRCSGRCAGWRRPRVLQLRPFRRSTPTGSSGRPQIDGQFAVLFDAVPRQDAAELRPRLPRRSLRRSRQVPVSRRRVGRGTRRRSRRRRHGGDRAGARCVDRVGHRARRAARRRWTVALGPAGRDRAVGRGQPARHGEVPARRARRGAAAGRPSSAAGCSPARICESKACSCRCSAARTFDALDEPTSPFNLLRTSRLPAGRGGGARDRARRTGRELVEPLRRRAGDRHDRAHRHRRVGVPRLRRVRRDHVRAGAEPDQRRTLAAGWSNITSASR